MMKPAFTLTDAEFTTLQQLSINHKHRDVRTRAMGLLRLAHVNRPEVVAHELCVGQASVYNWARGWRDVGIGFLLRGHAGGRHLKLTEAMVQTAIECATKESLSLAGIAREMEMVHGQALPCTLQTLSAALKKAGFSYKRARYSLKKKG